MKAVWKDTVIADSPNTVFIEGNHYFPLDSVNDGLLRPSDTQTTCPWKGTASYYDIVVGEDVNQDAAWSYPEPKPAAIEISGRIAFWRGVSITD